VHGKSFQSFDFNVETYFGLDPHLEEFGECRIFVYSDERCSDTIQWIQNVRCVTPFPFPLSTIVANTGRTLQANSIPNFEKCFSVGKEARGLRMECRRRNASWPSIGAGG
jgi:hypothetical protein